MRLLNILEDIINSIHYRRQLKDEEEQLLIHQATAGISLSHALEMAAKENPNFSGNQVLRVRYPKSVADEYGNYSIFVSVEDGQERKILQVNIKMEHRGEEIYVFDETVGNSRTVSRNNFCELKKELTKFVREYRKGMSFLPPSSIYYMK